MTYRQLTIRALAGMGIVLLAIVVSVITLTRSERFTVWLLDTLESRADGRVSFSGVSGTFAGELDIARLDAVTEVGALTLEDARLRFDLSGILARALIVDELSIGRASFVAADSVDSAPPAASALPGLVLVRDAAIGSLAVTRGGVTHALRELQLGLRYVDGSLQITDLSARWQNLVADASALIELGAAVSIDADVCLRGSLGDEALAGCGRVDGAYPALTIAAELAAPFRATAGGSVRFGPTPTLDIGVRWEDAALGRFADARSPRGTARLVGPLDRLDVTGTAQLVYLTHALDIAVTATRRPDGIGIESLSATSGETALRLSGEIAADLSRAALSVSGSHVNPALFDADWPGDLEIRTDLGLFAGAAARAELGDLTVGGELRGLPIAATGGLELTADALTFHDVLLVSRTDRVTLSGTVGPAIDLAARATIGDLAAWWPDVRGELDADLLIRGHRAAPRVSGELALRRARYRENEVDRLVAAGEAGLGDDGDRLDLVVGISGFRAAGLDIDAADAEIAGTIAAHTLSLRARAEQWALTASAMGGLAGTEWRGELRGLAIDPTSFENWALERPATLAVSRTALRLGETCLGHLDARVCVTLAREGEPSDVLRVTASEFDLGLLAPLLPAGLVVGGRLDAAIELDDLSGRTGGRITIDGRAGRVRAAATPESEVEIPLERFGLDATIDNGRLALSGEFATPQFAEGKLELAIEDLAEPDSPVEGDIELVWRDPAALSVLSPEVGEISGTVFVDLGITGRRDDPAVDGEARFENGAVEVPVWGLVIEDISGRATAIGGNRLAFTARGLIDDAELRVEGETALAADGSFPTTLRLRGEQIALVQRPEAEVFVTPNLRAEIALPNVSVSGRVDIPRAMIGAVGLPEQAATPSRDTIVHGREEQTVERPLAVAADLTVSLGDDVRYQDAKISAQVTGDLAVTYASERGAAAVGALALTGQYDAYGNPLNLERGRLTFAGPWRNPAVDVRAVRRIDEITVGVQLTGTLQTPETRIFSDPTMSETAALSYLLFGRPLEDTGDEDTAALESAALAMGLQQALPAIERIGETLGLDEFSIRGTATDAGALMAGKYLGPNLYLRYSYGLFNRIGGLLLRYRINDRLSLETQSGEQKSMDLLYTVEKE